MKRTLIVAVAVVALTAAESRAATCGSAILLEKSMPAVVQAFTLDASAVARLWSAGAASQHFNNSACATGCGVAAPCTTAPCVAITGINWLNATCGTAGTRPSRSVLVLERPTASSGGRWAAINLDKNSADANTDLDAKATSFCSGCASVASAYLGGTGVPTPTNSVASGGDLIVILNWTAPAAAAQALNNSGTSLVTSYAIYYRRGTAPPANDGVKSGWTRVADTDPSSNANGFSTDAVATVAVPLNSSTDDVYIAIGLNFDGTGNPIANANTVESSLVSAWAGPLPADPLATPDNLVATATSVTLVGLSWTAVAGADHYEVVRSSGLGPYGLIGSPTVANFNDTGRTTGTSYLYKVRAIGPAAEMSGYSAIDLATTVLFSDDPLSSGITLIRAAHVTELRTAVNAVRAAAGLAAASFTDGALTGVLVKALHLTQLRTALEPARTTLGLSPVTFGESITNGTTVRATHVVELRSGVK